MSGQTFTYLRFSSATMPFPHLILSARLGVEPAAMHIWLLTRYIITEPSPSMHNAQLRPVPSVTSGLPRTKRLRIPWLGLSGRSIAPLRLKTIILYSSPAIICHLTIRREASSEVEYRLQADGLVTAAARPTSPNSQGAEPSPYMKFKHCRLQWQPMPHRKHGSRTSRTAVPL